MRKALTIIKYLFTLVGAGLLVGAFFAFNSTRTFLVDAVEAQGSVISMIRSRSSSDSSYTYRPVVRFITRNGERVEFTSGIGSSPPAYSVGEKVTVLYSPRRPNRAKINSFFELWGISAILGGMGLLFFSVGFGILLVTFRNKRKRQRLMQHGQPVQTRFVEVVHNTSYSVNGRHPYQVITQWENPMTGRVHVYKSNNLWFDPTEYVQDKPITVMIDKNDPDAYHVNLSFLPKLA